MGCGGSTPAAAHDSNSAPKSRAVTAPSPSPPGPIKPGGAAPQQTSKQEEQQHKQQHHGGKEDDNNNSNLTTRPSEAASKKSASAKAKSKKHWVFEETVDVRSVYEFDPQPLGALACSCGGLRGAVA